MAEVRLISSIPGDGLEHVIERWIGQYLQRPFETFIVLPNAAIRDEIKQSLVGRGVPMFGACVCTLDELARYLFDVLEQDEMVADRYVPELILYRILEENKERLSILQGAWGTVRALVPELMALIDALKDFQVDYPRCLGALQSERTEQLALIKDQYEGALVTNHLADRGRMLERVISKLPRNGELRIGKIVFYGLYEPKPIERALIRTIIDKAEEAEYHLPYVEGNKAFTDNGSWLLSEKVSLDKANVAEHPLLLFSVGQRKHASSIMKGIFRDQLDEARSVARQIRSLISSGVEPNRIAVLMPIRSTSSPIVSEVLDDHGISYSLHFESSLASSPLVMSIFSILDVVLSNYDREAVRRMAGSPYLMMTHDHGSFPSSVSGREVEGSSITANTGAGETIWSYALRSPRSQVRGGIDHPEEMTSSSLIRGAEETAIAEVDISRSISVLSVLEGDLTVQERADALRGLIQDLRIMDNLEVEDEDVHEREVRALNSFLRLLDAMEMAEAMVPSGRISLGEFVDRLRMLTSVDGHREAPKNRNAVQVSGLRASYLMCFDHVFIIGMVDGDMPFLSAGNVFLREREVARSGLMSALDQLRHERFYFLSALMSSKVRTYISRAESNGSDMLVPSYFFDELEATFDMDTFGSEGGGPSTLCGHRLIGEMISKKREAEQVKVDLSVPLDEVCRRISVEREERAGGYTSTYDGVFADATIVSELHDIQSRSGPFSASRLESYARCPFTFYLESVLDIEPRPEVEEDLTPADKGTLFHRIAGRFYSELRSEGSTRFTESQLDLMTERIQRIGQDELDRYGLDGPAWHAFKRTMLGSDDRKGLLRAFLENEAKNRSAFEPKFFELSFGTPLEDGFDIGSVQGPATIDLGGEELKLRGRIDRVDVLPDGRFVVIDYKTGSTVPSVSEMEQGTALQVPLYVQAVESMFHDLKGIGGAYYIVRSEAEIEHKGVFGDKDHESHLRPYFGEKRQYRDDFKAIIQRSNQHVRSHLKGMRAGRFHPNTGPSKCPRNCKYATVCRTDGSRTEDDSDAD